MRSLLTLAVALLSFSAIPERAGGFLGGDDKTPAGWVKVTIPEGSSEIIMPSKPKRSEDTLENWGGRIYIYQVDVNKDLAYVASVTSVPTDEQARSLALRGDINFHLKEARDRVLSDQKGKLITEKAIDYHGHPGFELVYRNSEGFVRYRQYHIAVQKHYQAFSVIMGSNKQEDLTSKEADAFFRSFRVLKDVATRHPQSTASLPAGGSLFTGKDLTGWQGLEQYWSVHEGMLVGTTKPKGINFNTFLCSDKEYGDFEMTFKVKLVGGLGNSGIQIRSKIDDNKKYVVAGPQCDIGQVYWGSLYGERFGGMMKASPAEIVKRVVKQGDFNDYQIVCKGKHVTIKVNGATMVDDDFPKMPEKGILAFQLHGGGPMEVQFKEIKFKELK